MEWVTTLVPDYLMPMVAVLAIGWAVVKSLRESNSAHTTAVIEVTPEILEGVRADLRRATDETAKAREEAEHSRLRAEEAEKSRDEERDLRRKAEDDFHDYRVNARIWTAALIAQVTSTGQTPIHAPEGFDI